jgi:methanethiol oxidase
MLEKLRPDPTFYPSARIAMEAPAERLSYSLLLSPDHSKPDALAVVDLDPGSQTFGKAVYRLDMPYRGDEFHHFGWNACSSALSPFSNHPFVERRYLIIPGIRSSRIYIVDTKPDPTRPTIARIIEPEEVFHRTGYSRPHTSTAAPRASMSARSGEAASTAPKARPACLSWTATPSTFSDGGKSTAAGSGCTTISGGTYHATTW